MKRKNIVTCVKARIHLRRGKKGYEELRRRRYQAKIDGQRVQSGRSRLNNDHVTFMRGAEVRNRSTIVVLQDEDAPPPRKWLTGSDGSSVPRRLGVGSHSVQNSTTLQGLVHTQATTPIRRQSRKNKFSGRVHPI